MPPPGPRPASAPATATVMNAGPGDDTLAGGPAGDILNPGLGADAVNGGGATDFLSYNDAARTTGVTVTVGGGAPDDMARMLAATTALPIQLVAGYKGTAEIRLAAESGELPFEGLHLGAEDVATAVAYALERLCELAPYFARLSGQIEERDHVDRERANSS